MSSLFSKLKKNSPSKLELYEQELQRKRNVTMSETMHNGVNGQHATATDKRTPDTVNSKDGKITTYFSQAGKQVTPQEHDWQTNLSKKRKITTLPPSMTTTNIKLRNGYSNLKIENETTNISASTNTVKHPKMPPIFLQGIINFLGMLKKLSKFMNTDTLLTKSLANNAVKVTVEMPDEFRNLVRTTLNSIPTNSKWSIRLKW